MDLRKTLRTVAIVGALAWASVPGVHAQERTFTINGRLKVDGGGLDGARCVVFKNGEKLRTLTTSLGKFSMDLDVNAEYVFSFEKEGFVTKKLSFDTHAPAEAVANGFTPFEFAVSIFKQYDDVNTVVFNQPVGMIRFDKNADDFDYDTDYTKSIQSELDKTMKFVAEKQRQEKDKEDQQAKQKEADDKARAKADADKQKQEAEAAKQREKEEAQQQADAKKAEAAAKKAEQERLAQEAKKPKETPREEPKPKPRPEPPPAPVAKTPKPAPKPPPPVVAQRSHTRTEPRSGEDVRRKAGPYEVVEARPKYEEPKVEVTRNEELIVEPCQVITVVKIDNGKLTNEYRKVVRKYGSTFYFKNGQSCSKLTYDAEAMAENR